MIDKKTILSGDFIEFIVWFANGSTVSLSEFDGVKTMSEAQQRAEQISLREGRGRVVSLFRAT